MTHGVLARLRMRSAARRYAQRLPRRMSADYGASTYYTLRQIEAAAIRAKLPRADIRFGYAMFLPREAFFAAVGMEQAAQYEELRSMLEKYAPSRSASAGYSPLWSLWHSGGDENWVGGHGGDGGGGGSH